MKATIKKREGKEIKKNLEKQLKGIRELLGFDCQVVLHIDKDNIVVRSIVNADSLDDGDDEEPEEYFSDLKLERKGYYFG